MKFAHKIFVFITIVAIACTQVVPAFAVSEDSLDIQAQAAIVMDAGSGKILYEKDAYSKREPASTTKIVTCMLALEKLDLDQVITVRHDATVMGNIMEVKKGEEITVENLLYALMVYSANDAAVVLAEEMGGTVSNFAKMMDQKAAACGAKKSHFLNPNGLNWKGQEAHLTTAYDLAVMTREAMKNKTFRKLVSTVSYTIPATNKSKARKLESTNLCMWDTETKKVESVGANGKKSVEKFVPKYEGVIGVKTGLTSTAGGCYVGEINRNGAEIIVVVMHSGALDRFSDAKKLWNYALEKYYETHKVVDAATRVGKVRVQMGAHRHVPAVVNEGVSVTIPKTDNTEDVRTKFTGLDLKAPVKKGDKVGTVSIYDGETLLNQVDAVAEKSIEEGGPLAKYGIPDWLAIMMYIGIPLVMLLVIVLWALRRTKKKNV